MSNDEAIATVERHTAHHHAAFAAILQRYERAQFDRLCGFIYDHCLKGRKLLKVVVTRSTQGTTNDIAFLEDFCPRFTAGSLVRSPRSNLLVPEVI